jgi:ribosomal protein L10
MPKSKRNKVVHLTQVKKKGKDHKDDLLKQLKQFVDQYEFVYVFDFEKTKSDRIMNLRLKMKEYGRIFAGRNSLVAQALNQIGAATNTSYDKFLRHIVGHRGLLFTSVPRDELVSMLEDGHQEFLDKLLGYAQLKAPDDDTVGKGEGEEEDDQEQDDDDDDDDEEKNDEGDDANGDTDDATGGKTGRKCVSFRPIKRQKKKKRSVRPSG